MAQMKAQGSLTIIDTTDIARVKNWYLASASSSGVTTSTSGWTDDVTNTNAIMTATKQYLWNYEQVQGIGPSGGYITINTTEPVIIGRYGQNGAEGNSITSIDEYYQVTNSTTNPGSSGWSKNTLVVPTSTNKYLWNYQVINYSKTSAEGSYSDARIIGVYGDNGVSVTQTRELYYLKTNSTPVPTIYADTASSQITATDRQNGWTSIVPTYVANAEYWTCIETSLSNSTQVWSTPVKNNALKNANENAQGAMSQATAAQYQTEALAAKVKHYWWDSTGAHIASGINGADVTEGTISTYGFNSLVGLTSITFGYNSFNNVKLDASGTPVLNFYQPSKTAQGNLTMSLGSNALTFYDPSNGSNVQAVLNSTGLKLQKGGIEAGTKNTTDYIYVWSHDDSGHSININSSGNKTDWRIVAGNKFGVDKAGNLYASNAIISGQITVTSGSDLSAGLGNYSTTDTMNAAINTATNNNIVSATILYYASNSTTAPAKPTTHITTNSSTTRGAWNITLPVYNESYPYLYICTEYKTKNDSYSWTSVEQTSYTSAVSAIKTEADAAIKTQVNLYYASNSTTPPSKPTAHVTTNSTSTYGAWNIALPTYSATYPYLYTCKETLTNSGTYAWTSVEQSTYAAATAAIKTTADNAAPKTSAIKRTQRIYYRTTSSTPPSTPGTATANWVTNGNDEDTWVKYDAWSTRVPPMADSESEESTKYLYLWTCEQKEVVSATNPVSYTEVLLDESNTIIDGSHIITGSITANKLNVADINAWGQLSVGAFATDDQNNILNSNLLSVQTYEGSIVTFENENNALIQKAIVTIEPIQSGSGTPSASNVRDISGWDDININVSGEDTSSDDKNVYNISLSSAGTVYGGTLDITTGVLRVTKKLLTLDGSDTDNAITKFQYKGGNTSGDHYYVIVDDGYLFEATGARWVAEAEGTGAGMLCNYGPFLSGSSQSALSYNCYIGANGTHLQLYMCFPTSMNLSTLTLANTWLTTHNLQFIYPLATPITYILSPQQITTLLGTNNIWTDSGNTTVQVAYGSNDMIQALNILNEADDSTSKQITNFISADSAGIMIYDGRGGIKQSPSDILQNTRNVLIDQDSIDIRTGEIVHASFGDEGLKLYLAGNQTDPIAQYGVKTIIGLEDSFHIEIDSSADNAALRFYEGKATESNPAIAYIQQSKMFIEKSVVAQSLSVGRTTQETDQHGNRGKGQWSWQVHEVNDLNNLSLKWMG